MRLLFLWLVCSPALAFQSVTCKTDAVTGRLECAFYAISQPTATNWQEMSTPYADIVPPGETRQIRITHASVNPENVQPGYTGTHTLLIESPSGSGKWDVPLCWVKDGFGTCSQAFQPGLLLAPGDDLCLQSGSGNASVPARTSYAIHYIIGP